MGLLHHKSTVILIELRWTFSMPENRLKSTVSVHKDVFSYERLVATSVMEAAAFSLSMVDHGLDDSAIASISFMVARSTSPTPVK